MKTTMLEKANVKELANQALQGQKELSDSRGMTLTYTYDPASDTLDKNDKFDTGK